MPREHGCHGHSQDGGKKSAGGRGKVDEETLAEQSVMKNVRKFQLSERQTGEERKTGLEQTKRGKKM